MVIDYSALPIWFYPVLFWTIIWKGIAAWKAARKGHLSWFVAFFILNTFGILPILYIFFLNKVNFYSVDKKVIIKKRVISKKKVIRKKVKKIPTLD
ncbi:hypothetical protein KAS08_03535 [Candidatus Pacearchaeota archaeon]|nr:hypothetical protein [Candidatus Pacearchaeota archaeon]